MDSHVAAVIAPFTRKERSQIHRIKQNLRSRGFLTLAKTIASDHHLPVEVVLSYRRTKSVMMAKKALYRALRAHALSYPEVGALLEKNHSTIFFGCLYPSGPDLVLTAKVA